MLLTLFLIVIAGAVWYLSAKQPTGFPDGPRNTLPIIGDSVAIGQNFAQGFDRLREKYGDIFGLYMGPRKTVCVSSFDLIQEVGKSPAFIGRQEIFGRNGLRNMVNDGEGGLTQGGVIFSEGPTWVEQRRFALHKLKSLGIGKETMDSMIREEVAELCKYLEGLNEKAVDVRNAFNLAVVNALWIVSTSKRLDYEDPKLVKLNRTINKFVKESHTPLNVLAMMYKPVMILFKNLNLAAAPKALTEIGEMCDDIIQEHEMSYQDTEMRDFTDHFIKEQHEKSGLADMSSFKGADGRKNLTDILSDFFIAGSETTSSTMMWCMLYMLLFPDIQKKVQEEIDEVSGRARLLSYSDRVKTPYTEAVIHEVQRKGNVIPLSVAHTARYDAQLGGKYFIPKGTDIFSNLFHLMHDPKFFTDPHKFDPTRHLNKEGKFEPHPCMIPFGVGKRRCLGESLAKMSLYIFFTGLLSNFNLAKENDSVMLTEEVHVGGVRLPKPYKLRLIPRK